MASAENSNHIRCQKHCRKAFLADYFPIEQCWASTRSIFASCPRQIFTLKCRSMTQVHDMSKPSLFVSCEKFVFVPAHRVWWFGCHADRLAPITLLMNFLSFNSPNICEFEQISSVGLPTSTVHERNKILFVNSNELDSIKSFSSPESPSRRMQHNSKHAFGVTLSLCPTLSMMNAFWVRLNLTRQLKVTGRLLSSAENLIATVRIMNGNAERDCAIDF